MVALASGRSWIAKGARSVAALLLIACASPALAERLALVVGNGDYSVAPHLDNPVGDATAVARTLTDLDFKVTLLTDAKGQSLWDEMDSFVTRAEGAESVVFYYAGHAFQMSGVNYLVPVDARLESREALARETWSLDAIIARLQSRSRQTLIFLDACRNDPLPNGVRGSGAAADGLARVQAGVGTFVAFATAPGAVTADGVGGGEHSPFTTALLKHMPTKGKSVSDMMIEVRNDVENATARKQVPWDQSSLREQFYFVPREAAAKQELSEADYELLAQLDPADRKQFLDLLAQSGFDETSLQLAEAEIALAEANLEQVAVESSTTFLDEPETADSSAQPTADTADTVAKTEEPQPLPADDQASAGDAAGTPSVSLDDLQVADSSVIIEDAPAEDTTVVAGIDPALKPDEETGEAPIRLAALDWDTREAGLQAADGKPTRVTGRLVTPDTEEGRNILAGIDPRLVDSDTPVEIAADDLPRAVQSELQRVGCYQMTVDGNWGKGSRTALTSYFLAKRVVPTTLEPTAELYSTLAAEPKVVCEVRVAQSAVKTGKRAKVELASEEVSAASPKSNKKTGKKQETAKTRITKGTIGMTGSF
jgi:hypothetical protein